MRGQMLTLVPVPSRYLTSILREPQTRPMTRIRRVESPVLDLASALMYFIVA